MGGRRVKGFCFGCYYYSKPVLSSPLMGGRCDDKYTFCQTRANKAPFVPLFPQRDLYL